MMNTLTKHLNKKLLRQSMRRWGQFWRKREYGRGVSSVADLQHALLSRQSSNPSFYQTADAMQLPAFIDIIDKAVEQLNIEQKQVIVMHYIKRKSVAPSLLMFAEVTLCTLLDDQCLLSVMN